MWKRFLRNNIYSILRQIWWSLDNWYDRGQTDSYTDTPVAILRICTADEVTKFCFNLTELQQIVARIREVFISRVGYNDWRQPCSSRRRRRESICRESEASNRRSKLRRSLMTLARENNRWWESVHEWCRIVADDLLLSTAALFYEYTRGPDPPFPSPSSTPSSLPLDHCVHAVSPADAVLFEGWIFERWSLERDWRLSKLFHITEQCAFHAGKPPRPISCNCLQ